MLQQEGRELGSEEAERGGCSRAFKGLRSDEACVVDDGWRGKESISSCPREDGKKQSSHESKGPKEKDAIGETEEEDGKNP